MKMRKTEKRRKKDDEKDGDKNKGKKNDGLEIFIFVRVLLLAPACLLSYHLLNKGVTKGLI